MQLTPDEKNLILRTFLCRQNRPIGVRLKIIKVMDVIKTSNFLDSLQYHMGKSFQTEKEQMSWVEFWVPFFNDMRREKYGIE